MTLGDSLRGSIDEGLVKSTYGVVILSPSFFGKEWSQWELDGLVARAVGEPKVILPVWHAITHKDVIQYSSPLANKWAALTEDGLDTVVRKILDVVKPNAPWASEAKEPLPLPKQTGTVHMTNEYGTSIRPTFDLEALYKLHPLLRDAVNEVDLSTEVRAEMVERAYSERGWPSVEFPYSVESFFARYHVPVVKQPVIASHEDNSHNDLRGVNPD